MTKNDLLNTITHFGRKPMAFEPATEEDDNDELTKAINEPIYHDNHWDLHDDVDAQALQAFWDDAVKDVEDTTLSSQ
jgi:hypothetical protein